MTFPDLLIKPHSVVTVGPTQCQAVAPYRLALGPIRDVSSINLAKKEADAMDALFRACPEFQWGAAAQAAMSMRIEE